MKIDSPAAIAIRDYQLLLDICTKFEDIDIEEKIFNKEQRVAIDYALTKAIERAQHNIERMTGEES